MIARCVVVAVLFAAVALGQEVAPAETTPAAAVEATTVEGSGAAAAAGTKGYGSWHPVPDPGFMDSTTISLSPGLLSPWAVPLLFGLR